MVPGLSNPQPLAVGDRWIYSASDGSFEQVSVDAQRTVRGTVAAAVLTTVLGPQAAEPEESLVARSSDALVELAADDDPVSLALGNVSLVPLPLPTQARASVRLLERTVAAGYDLDNDGRPDAMSVTVDQEVLAPESITVAAGTFAQAARLRTVVRLVATLSASGITQTSNSTIDEWYAQDIGLLRDTVSTVVGTARSERTRQLTGYRVGGRSSDSTAPVIIARSPAAASTSIFLNSLTVDFDEPINPATFNASAIVLKDAAGQVVASTPTLVSATRATLLVANQPPTGTYTVTVSSLLADWWGNARPEQQWAVLVDRSGPAVARSTPAAGAVDVALNPLLELVFDEPINRATVSAQTVQLLNQFRDAIPTTLTVVDERTLRLQPLQPLQAGQTHVLWVGVNLQDRTGVGNANAQEVTFRTVQGLLAYPVQVGAGGGRSLAVGDYTGDGLADLLDMPDSSTPALRVHPRLPGGGLGTPRLLQLPEVARCGNVGLIQAAEMNGDGRLDVVVTRVQSSCGIQVLAQGGDGELSVVAELPSADNASVVVADLDGNGRLDVVASQSGGNTVTAWLQTGAGVFGAGREFAAINNARGRLAVGDVNGDGRPDIVMTSGQFDVARALTVLPQQADGSFGPPQSYRLADEFGETALVLADLNGDGRLDIAVQSPQFAGVWIFRQAPNGMLESAQVLPGLFGGAHMVAVDLNGDGRLDLASAAANVTLWLQNADGSFGPSQQFAGSAQADARLSVVDVSGDGRPDLVLDGPVVLRNLNGAAAPAGASSPAAGDRTAWTAYALQGPLGVPGQPAASAGRLKGLVRASTKTEMSTVQGGRLGARAH